jgi:hypothetical protein
LTNNQKCVIINTQNEREEKQMLKFKIKALMYALQEMRYEKGMFRENYRNRLIYELITHTHIHSSVVYAVLDKMTSRAEIINYVNAMFKEGDR